MKYVTVILFLFFSINLEAQEQTVTLYKEFKKKETVKIVDNSRLSKYIGKSNGRKVILALAIGRKDKVSVYLNDSFCFSETITSLDNSDYDMHIILSIPGWKKNNRVYLYLENSKEYFEIPLKRKFYFIRVYDLYQEDWRIKYSNNAPW